MRATYGRAVAGMARRHRPDALPPDRLDVADVAIDLDRLAAYDRVCGFTLTDRVPATYPHVQAFPVAMRLMNSPSFPFGVIGLVHIGNTINQRRPLAVTEKIDFQVYVSDLRPHDRGRQFDLTAIGSVDGDEAWRGMSTYLKRENSGNFAAPGSASASVGIAPSALWSVGRDVGTAYAKVSGDRNPIHTSRLGARAFGFPGPIAHGMWTAARCLAALEGRLPDAYDFEVSFRRPIRLPSEVTFGAQDGTIEVRGTGSVTYMCLPAYLLIGKVTHQ